MRPHPFSIGMTPAFAKFLHDMQSDFSLYRDSHGIDHGPIWKGEWSAP